MISGILSTSCRSQLNCCRSSVSMQIVPDTPCPIQFKVLNRTRDPCAHQYRHTQTDPSKHTHTLLTDIHTRQCTTCRHALDSPWSGGTSFSLYRHKLHSHYMYTAHVKPAYLSNASAPAVHPMHAASAAVTLVGGSPESLLAQPQLRSNLTALNRNSIATKQLNHTQPQPNRTWWELNWHRGDYQLGILPLWCV